jgi:RIM-binding protein of the cytomatrix active zone
VNSFTENAFKASSLNLLKDCCDLKKNCPRIQSNDYIHYHISFFFLHLRLQELEIRLETQKQTLIARDESIKKLLEMLQNKGMGE